MQQRMFHNIIQNTQEWYDLRLGKFTASTFSDLFMDKTTKGYEKAIYKPVFERLTKESPETYSSEYMERGTELEPIAVDVYEKETFNIASNGGFFTLGDWVGASPDRLVDTDGLLEIKAPAYNTMINYLLKKTLPNIYKWQVQGQLLVSDRKWCDFMAFHPKLNPLIIRVDRDESMIEQLYAKLIESIELAKSIISKLIKK